MMSSTFLMLFYLVPMLYAGQGVRERPQVDAEYDREYDFTRLHTFAWSSEQKPAPNPADDVRITKAVTGALEEVGLKIDTTNADVRLLYQLEVEQKKLDVESRQRDSAWDPTDLETTVSFGSHEQTYLSLTMFDAETGRQIWRARCAHPQPTADKVEPSLYKTVEHLFETYPKDTERAR